MRRRAEDWRAGVLAALFRNANRPKNSRASEPGDFFDSLRERKTERDGKARGQTPEQMLAIFQVITGAEVQ
jgi:hypothetical protein